MFLSFSLPLVSQMVRSNFVRDTKANQPDLIMALGQAYLISMMAPV